MLFSKSALVVTFKLVFLLDLKLPLSNVKCH